MKKSGPYKHHAVGIGNAIVDVIARTGDAFLTRHNLKKGSMSLIDAATAAALYGEMGPAVEVSGGSAANTIAGVAALGGKAAFIGKVGDDSLGEIFRHDIRSLGVAFTTPSGENIGPTARSFILVTPDAQRTMNTFLGASQALSPEDVDEVTIKSSLVTYLEGYLWDPPEAKQAFLKAIEIAKAAGRSVALTLSDAFCVARHRAEFRALVENSVDILFANENEITSLYEANAFEEAVEAVRGKVEIAALTRSEKGSLILSKDGGHLIPAKPVKVVDTTGAGDLYAAGFLYGLTHDFPLPRCGKLAAACAAEVISHMGARPEADLKTFLKGPA
ncbi:MAG TPA: adenosine kinase [Sphingomonadales bacterium]|nr:adenosine kinase [Sphingomonadales bacterium]